MPQPPLEKGTFLVRRPLDRKDLRIPFQYNPERIRRHLGVGPEPPEWALPGPKTSDRPWEFLEFSAAFDATDALERPRENATTVRFGLHHVLASLELLMARETPRPGTFPPPSVTLSWGDNRRVPVRVVRLTVHEEAFDAQLNPTRAKVDFVLRVVDEKSRSSRADGGAVGYWKAKERMARLYVSS